MPSLDISELNIVISVLGAFILAYGFFSVKIKQVWYLGEALPAVFVGVCLGPIAAKFLSAGRWGSAEEGQQEAITLGLCRIVIGAQLVIAGFQLPAQYQMYNWKEMAICLLPVMTIMWLCTTLCILATIPNLSLLAALVIGSCVTCTDPILSQAVAKGPFADKFVPRALREIISSEAGANDGFGFPFLLLATYLIRHAELEGVKFKNGVSAAVEGATEGAAHLLKRNEDGIGRLGGGVSKAMEQWIVEGWLYIIVLSVVIGVILGYGSMYVIKFALKKKWIDTESFMLWPMALGLFTIGICGVLGTDDLLACFVAGNALNWNGMYLEESEKRHDEVNSCFDVILNFGGFMYIGTIIPWSEFHQPDTTGITIGRLMMLGVLILIFRRIPAIFMTYKIMPRCVKDWKEALFMGYFGPIGIGAVFYVEHTRHLFPTPGEAMTEEEDAMTRAMIPVVYWLVLFSIIVHGLSIPALDAFYRYRKIAPIFEEEPAEVRVLSTFEPLPNNAYANPKRNSVLMHNRFSRPISTGPNAPGLTRWNSHDSQDTLNLGKDDDVYAQKLEYIRRYGGKFEEQHRV
ncbi:Na(+)/H(+) antiporter 1 [Clohesyomyces aquaticus]|uniref:Na(+)/H(+) antiporter 1 n=1 Tax=Clohesyomyces aquaticus TaxID=1231657 RepID=A0A1Y1ZCQ8_9PLEO|nr:Na(+)/H(+) antiporter 1 [Clohesyomyces aquaticus]